MEPRNLYLSNRQMVPQKKLRLEENTNAKSLFQSDLPPEILAKILRHSYDFPMLFNHCLINRQFNQFIHNHFKNIGIVEVAKYLKMDKSVHIPRTASLPRRRSFQEIMHQIVAVRHHTLNGLILNERDFIYPGLLTDVLMVLKMCVRMESFELLHIVEWTTDTREKYDFAEQFKVGSRHLNHLRLIGRSKWDLSGCTELESLNLARKLASFPSYITDLTLAELVVDSVYSLHNVLLPVAMNLEQLCLTNIRMSHSNWFNPYYNHDTHHGQLDCLKLPKLQNLNLSVENYEITQAKIKLDLCDSINIELIRFWFPRYSYFEIVHLNLSSCPNLVKFHCFDDGCDNRLHLALPSFPVKWNNLKELSGFASSSFDLALQIVSNSPRLEYVNLDGSCDVTVYKLATLVAAVYRNHHEECVKIKCKLQNDQNSAKCCLIEFCQNLLHLLSGCKIKLKSLSYIIETGSWCESTCTYDDIEFDKLISEFKENYAIQIVFPWVPIDGFRVTVCHGSTANVQRPQKTEH